MATLFTKTEARTAARNTVLSKSNISTESYKILREDRIAAKDSDTFDIFLSHSINDADLVLGVKRLLEKLGKRVYVDWDTDNQLDRNRVTAETASLLRSRMAKSKSLLYLATDAASSSKWMPWELGYFDGLRNGLVAVMPLVDNPNDSFLGQEYLSFYPKVTKDTYSGSAQEDVFVEGGGRWTTLREFNMGYPNWRS